ncbi:MAG: hypothetical protein ACE5GQ_02245 [Nitrospinales bacterium]
MANTLSSYRPSKFPPVLFFGAIVFGVLNISCARTVNPGYRVSPSDAPLAKNAGEFLMAHVKGADTTGYTPPDNPSQEKILYRQAEARCVKTRPQGSAQGQSSILLKTKSPLQIIARPRDHVHHRIRRLRQIYRLPPDLPVKALIYEEEDTVENRNEAAKICQSLRALGADLTMEF